jgi:hypothetical protein
VTQFSVSPNPFSENTLISYGLAGARVRDPADAHARSALSTVDCGLPTIAIYDLSGRLVKSFPFNHLTIQPFNQITWDGKNSEGKAVACGIYFCKLQAGDQRLTRKLIRLQ